MRQCSAARITGATLFDKCAPAWRVFELIDESTRDGIWAQRCAHEIGERLHDTLGENTGRWEVYFSLLGEFDGTLAELSELCVAAA